jgi:uncharacterized OB-fold protein
MPEHATRPVHEGLFTEEHLIGGRCGACSRYHFPAAAICPYCGSDDIARVALSDTGTLWGWTAVTAPAPGYQGDVTFGFGVVELPEGIRVITRVEEPDPARLSFGMLVRFATAPLNTDDEGTTVVTYTFVPVGPA